MRGERLLCSSIADNLAVAQFLYNLLEVVFADDVRGDDELPLRMLAEIAYKNVLVGRPTAAGHEHFRL